MHQAKQERTKRKIILANVIAALTVGYVSQTTFAKDYHHIRKVFNVERFRNTKACAVPYALPSVESVSSGSMGGWASMTGFD